jgi:uncharacterized caspase-like protein
VSVMGAGLRPHGKPWDQPPYPKMQSAPHFYPDQPTLRLAIADFIERIEKAGSDAVVFLYYSGHGAADRTERGENYLIPVGAKITFNSRPRTPTTAEIAAIIAGVRSSASDEAGSRLSEIRTAATA